MSSWRDELSEIIKSKAEREAEEAERRKQRLQEALAVADEALASSLESLRFADEQLRSKKQPCTLEEAPNTHVLRMQDQQLKVELSRDSAMLTVSYNDSRPREFDFSQDRHLSPRDVEEYVGRRTVELARAAQQAHPW